MPKKSVFDSALFCQSTYVRPFQCNIERVSIFVSRNGKAFPLTKAYELNNKNALESALNPQTNGLAKNEMSLMPLEKFSNDDHNNGLSANNVLAFANNDIAKGNKGKNAYFYTIWCRKMFI